MFHGSTVLCGKDRHSVNLVFPVSSWGIIWIAFPQDQTFQNTGHFSWHSEENIDPVNATSFKERSIYKIPLYLLWYRGDKHIDTCTPSKKETSSEKIWRVFCWDKCLPFCKKEKIHVFLQQRFSFFCFSQASKNWFIQSIIKGNIAVEKCIHLIVLPVTHNTHPQHQFLSCTLAFFSFEEFMLRPH